MSNEPMNTTKGTLANSLPTPSPEDVSRATESRLASEFVPSILDREVSKGELDAFGHRHFAEALRGLIEAPEHQPPYSIGLLGGWGTGKSSVKSMYLNDLIDSTGPKGRSRKIRSITFNAWRFGGEDIRRALLRDVFVQLGGNEAAIHEQFFAQTSQIVNQSKGLADMFKESWQRLLWIFVQLLLIFSFGVALAWIASRILGIDASEYYTWLAAVFVGVSAFAFKALEKSVVNRFTDVTKIELPKASAEQYEKLLKDHLVAWKRREREVERLVIFVDDLDRLSSEEMVDGLDAIRALMELPTGGAGVGVVFVISCDEELVAEALSKRAKTATELPGAISNRQDARRYLDRIFQFRLDIPPTPRLDMRSFAVQLLKRDCFKQITDRVITAGSSIEEVVSRMIHVGVQNPRNAIQIVNAFAASMWIAMKREFEGSGSARAGALSEGAVTGHPLSLAVLSALKVDFPEFYRVLQSEPGALDGFVHIFIRGDDPSDLPGSVSAALRPFAMATSEDEASWKIQEKFLPLRQFISSVQAVRLPDALLPLIILNQDELSRRTGDAGARLYNPIVSGDVLGVLKALGREADERPLQLQEVESIFAVWELVETDSQDRRENAAFVLAELVARCQPDQARKLAIPVAPTICGSLSLRNRLGISTLKTILPLVRDLDRSALQRALIADFGLIGEAPISATTKTGKALSLDDAIMLVHELIVLLMEEWTAGKLTSDSQEAIASWMLERNVAVSEKAMKVLPFSVVDSWASDYEQHLLPALGIDYAFAVASELGNKEPSLAEKEKARARMLKILEQERKSPRYWELLCEISQIADVDSCLAAQKLGRKDLGTVTPDQVARWTKVLANRVKSYADEELQSDDQDAVDLLVELCRGHTEAAEIAADDLRDCAIALSETEGNAALAVSLLQGLSIVSNAAWSVVVTDWFGRLSTDLPSPCARELGANVDKTSDEPLVTARSTGLRSCMDDPSGGRTTVLEAYWSVAKDQVGIASSSMQVELSHILQRMEDAASDFGSIESLWPVFRIALHKASESAGNHVDALFTRSRATPESFIDVMRFLEPEWPLLGELAPLTASKVVAQAIPVITDLTPAQRGGTILKSLHSLLGSASLVDDEKDKVVSAVTPIWGNFAAEATDVVVNLADHLSTEELVLITDQWQTDPETLLPQFKRIVVAAASSVSESELAGMLSLWAGRPAVSAGGTNDAAVISLITTMKPDVARKVVLEYGQDPGNPLDSRRRVLQRATGIDGKIGHDWATSYLRATASVQLNESMGETVRMLNASATETDRYGISMQLLKEFPSIGSIEEKRALIAAISELGGQAACETYAKSDSANLEDITLLNERFPRSRKIFNAQKKLSKTS